MDITKYIRLKYKSGQEALILWKRFIKLKRLFKPEKVKTFKNCHKGRVVFCVGAGPSLNQENVQLLKGHTAIFTNSSYKILSRIDLKSKYWFVQDQNRLKELASIDRTIFNASFKSVHTLKNIDFSTINTYDIFLMPKVRFKRQNGFVVPEIIEAGNEFSECLDEKLNLAGNTVIFSAIQMAYYMGAETIALLGVDMDYGKNPQESYFDKGDFSKRAFWPIPYQTSTRQAFVAYKKFLESKNIRFVNCSRNTKEDVLEKVTLETLLKAY